MGIQAQLLKTTLVLKCVSPKLTRPWETAQVSCTKPRHTARVSQGQYLFLFPKPGLLPLSRNAPS